MPDILKEIKKVLPPDKISDATFEGANIVLYTKDKDYVLDNKGTIREAVNTFKKRIELRPDPEITMEEEKAKKIILGLIPKEAAVEDVKFDPFRSIVVIETEKPGLVIGKQGEILKEIKEKTLWVPIVERTPAIKSPITQDIRNVLYIHSEERRKFLDKTGHRIYDGWIREKKNEWIRITHLGGARQVGRSCLFLQTPESRILLDCGIDVASDSEPYPYLEAPEFNIKELDAVIISHAHLDHTGLLPYLFKFGYDGPVYCTAPTRDIMALLQLDVIKITHGELKDPLYTTDEIKQMVLHTIPIDYEEVTDITPDVRLTFYNAGHILGSALVHLHIGNGLHNLLYTGDLKYGKSNLLEPAHTRFPRLETMIIESTYGGKDNIMPPEKECDQIMIDMFSNTLARGGKVLMPVLGSGRAQEVMVMVEELIQKKILPTVTVYLDGLLWDVTAIHTAYPEFMNRDIRKRIFHKDEDPFLNPIFKRVGSAKERQQIIDSGESCIIIATSGMLVGGPSLEYFKQLCENSKNSLVFSCYQGEGSMGRRIQRGEREFTFKSQEGSNQTMTVKMEVHRIEISGHSDRRQLLAFVNRCDPHPKKVIVVHGESSRCLDLGSAIHKQNNIETVCPRNLETIRIK